ncbi:MAG: NAD(P)/FAD-dependent oxidoreductase [Candidatus Calescibacterium sp.]|nr:NAD(P)/FAD-dependent oxidoreductase [Candidatus Calescibacterium sp.]MDW8132864.1 NAD(P)/FAD-dependent oxidoreductase [Candidatus Calescibacterium sp.]
MKEVFIIGGGPGGIKLAQELRVIGFNGKIHLLEDRFLGGECTNVGCIPSKTIYNFSKMSYKFRKMFKKSLSFDIEIIVSTLRKTVGTIRKGIEYNLKKAEVDVVNSKGILYKDKLSIDGKLHGFDAVVVATGSIPVRLGYNHERILTNRELWGDMFDTFVNDLKKGIKVLIVGAGYIGLETVSIFSNLFDNSHFVIIEKERSIIPTADDDIISEVHKSLLKNNSNVNILTNSVINKIEPLADNLVVEYVSNGNTIKDEFSFVVFSLGRKPNIPMDGVDKIEVDEFLRIKGLNNVWAIGDVIGGKLLAHKAEYQAKIVANNLVDTLQGGISKHRYTKTNEIQIPSIMFSIPEVGWYGFTERELKDIGLDYTSKKVNMASNARAIVDNSREGFIKVLYNNRGEILGVHVIAENVSELINIPMVYNSETIVYPHPTTAEIFNELL